ncbi:MAG: EamA family transporter, partial [Armatimonadetes bacterium]|nr:EamA family transporter [Armatimonadota bacterium]NIM68399.1 EamA family transporter [Armatimonadota bacterium]NIM76785.1 EamA family transporter [Armatimonadota bacterium]NIO74416.1 EamA family transporter [Armatimonadota bacterium]
MISFSSRHWGAEKLQSVSFLLLAVLIWGIQPFVLKIVLHFFSVPFTAFIRSFAAAILFGVLMAGMKARPVNANIAPKRTARRIAVWLIVGGVGLGVANLFWNSSLLLTTVGATSVLQLSSSVVLALYGILLLSERCTIVRTAGLTLSLCGMFLVTWNGQDISALGSSHAFRGNIFGLSAGLGWGICAIAQKVAGRDR